MTVRKALQNWLPADWPVPANIQAGTTLRPGGVSRPPYDSFNLGLHVHDESTYVISNRQRLVLQLALPHEPVWLEQVHGISVVNAAGQTAIPKADASYTDAAGVVCAVMTADCLPVLFCDRQGTQVAAAHAGWRGLAGGILEATLQQAGFEPEHTLTWLGPGIGAAVYEVGAEVRDAFLQQPMHDESAFVPSPNARWYMDMYRLARQRLNAVGVRGIYGGEYCTYSQEALFFSYRRDGFTGRMASLIWMR